MKINRPILLLISVILVLSSCKKTYEEGPAISFKTKFSRITGKWRLVSMEGLMADGSPIERIHPEVDQYLELTKEEKPSLTNHKVYTAYFTDFQEEYLYVENETAFFDDTLFTTKGSWWFTEWDKKNDGLLAPLGADVQGRSPKVDTWKILRLTGKEFKITNYRNGPLYGSRTLTFEKIN
jgi:hypothetical protein